MVARGKSCPPAAKKTQLNPIGQPRSQLPEKIEGDPHPQPPSPPHGDPRPPRISDRLLAAYLETDIRVRGDSEWEEDFHVITAFNPLSEWRSQEENKVANRELKAALVEEGRIYRPAVNRSPEGRWVEPGFAVERLTREEAREMGRRFGQYAVFEIGKNELRVVACFEERVEVVRSLTGTRLGSRR